MSRIEPALDSDAAHENVGLACWHLLRPPAKREVGGWISLQRDRNIPSSTFDGMLRRIANAAKAKGASDDDAPPNDGGIVEHHMEG